MELNTNAVQQSAEDAMTFTHGGYTNPLSEHEVRNELIASELSRVYYLAHRIHQHLPQHILLEDLVNVGVLGLIEAADKYNPDKHASLQSFASFRIRGAIFDSLRGLDWGARRLRQKGRNVAESINKLSNKLGRQPAQEEIARDLALEISELHALLGRLHGLNIVCQTEGSRFDNFENLDLIESVRVTRRKTPSSCACVQRETTS